MNNLVGQSIGRYHVVEKLGEGGMATVFKAFDTRLERDVAIKLLRTERLDSKKAIQRFEIEAKALAKLNHPNIVQVLDYGEHDGTPYLVIEYVPGGTLKKQLGKPMPWQQAAKLMVPIARALAYAHENNLIHRDVKPSNILITSTGIPKLSDFGIAKILELDETMDLTGTSVGVGTPWYMSPEQGKGKNIDQRSDIYSLGIVFYELVTGRKPYSADTPLAVLLQHVSDPLPRPTQFVRGLPKHVEGFLFKALAKNPDHRFQSMEEIGNAMEQMGTGAKAKVRVKRIAPRWAWAVLGGLAVVALISTVGIWVFPKLPISIAYQFTETSTQAPSATIQPSVTVDLAAAGTALIEMTQTVEEATSDAQMATIYAKQTLQKEKSDANQTQSAAHYATVDAMVALSQVPTLEPTVTKTQISAGTILFEEDFDDNKTLFSPWEGNWQIVSESNDNLVYEIDNRGIDEYPGFEFGSTGWRDYEVEFRVRFFSPLYENDTVKVHLDVRRTDYHEGATMAIFPAWDEVILAHDPSGKWNRLVTKNFSINSDIWYIVRVRAREDQFTVFIDNNLIIDHWITGIETGNCIINVGPGTHAQFDDIRVISLGY